MFHVTERPGQLAGRPITSADRNTFQTHTGKSYILTSTQVSIQSILHLAVFFLERLKGSTCLSQTHAVHSHTSTDRFVPLPPTHPPIKRSISHFTASYTFLCHSRLQLHSNSRLAQQRRLQGSSPGLPLTHTHKHTFMAQTVRAAALLRA